MFETVFTQLSIRIPSNMLFLVREWKHRPLIAYAPRGEVVPSQLSLTNIQEILSCLRAIQKGMYPAREGLEKSETQL